MSIGIEILNCENCGRPTRPTTAKVADHPGTVVRGSRDLCVTCYKASRPAIPYMPVEGPRIKAVPRDVVFAVVEAPRDPQRADCRIGCCKTPFMCAQGYRCDCHWRSRL